MLRQSREHFLTGVRIKIRTGTGEKTGMGTVNLCRRIVQRPGIEVMQSRLGI